MDNSIIIFELQAVLNKCPSIKNISQGNKTECNVKQPRVSISAFGWPMGAVAHDDFEDIIKVIIRGVVK